MTIVLIGKGFGGLGPFKNRGQLGSRYVYTTGKGKKAPPPLDPGDATPGYEDSLQIPGRVEGP